MCTNCGLPFTHSEVADDVTLMAFYFPPKPEFPPEGQELECTNCWHRVRYKDSALRYQQ
jgi:hypothetical protein